MNNKSRGIYNERCQVQNSDDMSNIEGMEGMTIKVLFDKEMNEYRSLYIILFMNIS